MRRFLLLFSAVFLSMAAVAESSYTIQFKTADNQNGGNVSTKVSDYITTESQSYVSEITTSTKAYPASIKGVKFNASSGGAVFTMSLAGVAQVKVTKIVANACLFNKDTGSTISINGKAAQTITSTTLSDYTFEFDGSTVITEIKITGSTSNSKRFYVSSLIVYYDDSVEDPTDCGLSFKETSMTITYGTVYTLPALSNPNNVNVTWSTDDATIATFDAENNLQIHKAGKTIITATLADEGTAYTQNTSASYELTIEKGTPVFAYTESSYNYVMKTDGEGFAAPTLNNPGGLVVTYSSNNSEVATVSADGVITPITRGEAVITATGAANDLWNGATATLTIKITKNIPTLTFTNTEVSKHFDEVVSYTGEAHYTGETLTIDPADLEITYSVDNAEVASINETTGELTFTGALGTVTVTATSTETAVYESQTATYTVTVIHRYAYLDQNAVLVTDVNDLQEGDIIIIVNQAASVAMSTDVKTNNFGQTEITLSEDNTTITSINDETVLLIELEKSGDYWLFKTLNRLEKNGYLLNTSLGSNYLKTVASVTTDNPLATIAIAESGVATVKFNKGGDTSSSNRNWLRYNSTNSPQIFSCYYTTQSDIYIYKANVPTFAADLTIAPDENEKDANVITLSNVNISNGLAFDFTGYNVYLNDTELGGTDGSLAYLPFIPSGRLTISNGTYTYPIAVTWPDLAGITAKITNVKYWAWKDKEHATGTEGYWYLDAEYTVAADTEMELAVEYEFTGNASGVGHVKTVTGNTAYVEGIGWFSVETETGADGKKYDVYEYVTDAAGDFIVTPKFPLFVKTALNDKFMAPEGTTRTVAIEGAPLMVEVEKVAQQPDGSDTGNVSGVESVVVDSEGAVEYYNLQGVRVEGALTPGIYIRRTATGTSKVAIR